VKAIVVDDDYNLREMIVSSMRRRGWECMDMADGKGLDVYMDKYIPDVILIDYHIPGEDGVEIARRARDKGLKSLVMTGFDSGQFEAVKNGIPLIVKPFTIEELMLKMADVVKEGI
jgi:DNA-binding response OmpR family regulator